jgi:hypothetical protein
MQMTFYDSTNWCYPVPSAMDGWPAVINPILVARLSQLAINHSRWHFGRFHQKAARRLQLPEPIGISPSHTHKSCAFLPCGPHPLTIFQPILVLGLYNVLLIMKAKRDSAKGPEPFFGNRGMGSRPNVKSHFNNRDSTNTKPHFILTLKTQTRQCRW